MHMKQALLSVGLLALLSVSTASMAQTEWQKTHPRRTEVNGRLAHQDARIDHKVRNGTMSRSEARNLHRQDNTIRAQERADARAHNSHVTRYEKKRLNHEENHVSQQIKSS